MHSCRMLLGKAHPQPIKEQIDHRRRKQRQRLRDDQATDDRDSQRPPQLTSCATAQRQRKTTKHRRHRRHHDRTEAQQACFVDRLPWSLAAFTLGYQRKVDHHDGVLLHDADQQDDADHRNNAQLHLEQQQRDKRADSGRRQRRKNRQRMDEALVEHAQDDVNRNQRQQNQHWLARQRRLEGLRRSLEAAVNRRRHSNVDASLFNRHSGVAQRHTGREIEAQSCGRRLRLVVDRQRDALLLEVGDRAERNHCPGRALDVNILQRIRITLILRRNLHHNVVLVQRPVGCRHLPLPKGVGQGRIDRQRRNAKAAGRIAVDHQLRAQPLVLLVGCDVLELRQLLHGRHQLRRPFIQVVEVIGSQRILVLSRRVAPTDAQFLLRLQIKLYARNIRSLRTQTIDDDLSVVPCPLPFSVRLEEDEHVSRVGTTAAWTAAANERHCVLYSRIVRYDLSQVRHIRLHRVERDVLLSAYLASNTSRVLLREEPLRNKDVEIDIQRKRQNRNGQHKTLVPEHPLQAAFVLFRKPGQAPLTPAIENAMLSGAVRFEELRTEHRRRR